MILAAAALVVSYTRTGWVMVVLGAMMLGLVRYRSLLLIVPLMVGVALLLPGVQSRVQSVNQTREIQYGTGNSFQSRVSLWEQNLPKAQQKPLTGLGLGAIVEQSDTQSHVHSDYVRAAVETGLLGFLTFVWLLLGALVGCLAALRWAARSRSVPLQAAALAGIAGSAAYLLASGDSNLMTQSAVSGTAWALFACAHAAGRLGREAVAPRPLRPTVARRLRVLGAPGIRTAAYSVQRATR
jgi:O-antigen ligase